MPSSSFSIATGFAARAEPAANTASPIPAATPPIHLNVLFIRANSLARVQGATPAGKPDVLRLLGVRNFLYNRDRYAEHSIVYELKRDFVFAAKPHDHVPAVVQAVHAPAVGVQNLIKAGPKTDAAVRLAALVRRIEAILLDLDHAAILVE